MKVLEGNGASQTLTSSEGEPGAGTAATVPALWPAPRVIGRRTR